MTEFYRCNVEQEDIKETIFYESSYIKCKSVLNTSMPPAVMVTLVGLVPGKGQSGALGGCSDCFVI